MLFVSSASIKVPLTKVVLPLSTAVDLVSPVVFDHHVKVAYIAYKISEQMGLPPAKREEVFIAGALHDIGALSLQERLDALNFDVFYDAAIHRHAEIGYRLLKLFEPFSNVARIVRFHHYAWDYGRGRSVNGEEVPLESHLIHLSDRISVLVHSEEDVLTQAERIRKKIRELSGEVFNPEIVEAFMELSFKEYFWFDLTSNILRNSLYDLIGLSVVFLDREKLEELARLFSHVIDFRSRFTATHSFGVAATAEKIAEFYKFSEMERHIIRIAGYFHDLGKLAVPTYILEKPGRLTSSEYNVMKSHAFYSYRILETIDGFDIINAWGALHHERLDGSGYPFHLTMESIPLGARIMAVADVFTALTEDRPYRKGMKLKEALKIIKNMVSEGKLCGDTVYLLEKNIDEIDFCRSVSQKEASKVYERFWRGNS